MEIHDYNVYNYISNDDWNYLEDDWYISNFEFSTAYDRGNGHNFLQNDQELKYWYDVNLII